MKDKRHNYTLRLDIPTWERLRKLSYERNESISSLLDGIISEGLNIVESDKLPFED